MNHLKQRKQIERTNSANKFFFIGVTFVSAFVGGIYFGLF